MKEIIDMFRSSPLEAVKKHADLCLECAEALPKALTTDGEARKEALEVVRRLERQADEVKAGIRHQMTKRLFMPVPKTQILELLHAQDKVANRAKDIATLFFHRFDELPEPIVNLLLGFVEVNLAVIRQAHRSVHELDELVETGFRGVEAELVSSMVEKLDELESVCDRHQWDIFSKLKVHEKDVSAVDAMFIYRLVTLIADLGDYADRTGRLLELMLTA